MAVVVGLVRTCFSCPAAVGLAGNGDCGRWFTTMDNHDGFVGDTVLSEVGDPGAVSERHEGGS